MNTRLEQMLNVAASISRGEIPPYQYNECFTSGAFDLLLVNVVDSEAFDLLREACGRYEELKSSGLELRGYYLLLSQLAYQSNTTEVPAGMADVIKENPELSTDLRKWYRYEV